jgi:hypothetical protein
MQISNGTKNKVASILSSGRNVAGNLQPRPHELEFVAVSTRLLGAIYLLLVNSRNSELQERQSKYNNLEAERLEKDRRNAQLIKVLTLGAGAAPTRKVFKSSGGGGSSLFGALGLGALGLGAAGVAAAPAKPAPSPANLPGTHTDTQGNVLQNPPGVSTSSVGTPAIKMEEITQAKPSAEPITQTAPSAAPATSTIPVKPNPMLSAALETGSSNPITKVGQIVEDPKGSGRYSYGIYGINASQPGKVSGSIKNFIHDNPQFGMTESMSLTEVNKKWKKVSAQNPQAMLDAQNAWYDKYIVPEGQKNLKKVPEKFHSPKLIDFLADRALQMGPYGEGAFSYAAANSKTSSEFITNMVKWDNEHITEIFPKAIASQKNKDRPRYIASLRRRSAKRGAAGLGIEYVPEQWLSKEDVELLKTSDASDVGNDVPAVADAGTDPIRMARYVDESGRALHILMTPGEDYGPEKMINGIKFRKTEEFELSPTHYGQNNGTGDTANVETVPDTNDMAIYFQKQLEYQRGFA